MRGLFVGMLMSAFDPFRTLERAFRTTVVQSCCVVGNRTAYCHHRPERG